MQINENFNPALRSNNSPSGLNFRLAELKDVDALTNLTLIRNPTYDPISVRRTAENEVANNFSKPRYRIFVADLAERVLGFCRFYHSGDIDPEKILFPAPAGWYCMGTIVLPEMRRQGIARFLSANRIRELKALGARQVYSGVAADNLTSIAMHKSFGFQCVENIPGFLQIKFDCGDGLLFKLSL